ncbi:hydrocephalus-inducing protein-like [Athene cunicularia]|uniref:hydrocephalus-inducing protein-like n=1 Tax=Athene cunicularia TaxID=194338 RepID=UPI000EF6FDAC|nr:hydrocephalus-inducing protein-like [Athene cunicularia]
MGLCSCTPLQKHNLVLDSGLLSRSALETPHLVLATGLRSHASLEEPQLLLATGLISCLHWEEPQLLLATGLRSSLRLEALHLLLVLATGLQSHPPREALELVLVMGFCSHAPHPVVDMGLHSHRPKEVLHLVLVLVMGLQSNPPWEAPKLVLVMGIRSPCCREVPHLVLSTGLLCSCPSLEGICFHPSLESPKLLLAMGLHTCPCLEAPHLVLVLAMGIRSRPSRSSAGKVVLEPSPYFKLTRPSGVCCKVAPGMCSTFRILFTPEENKDYFYQVTCITEREKFIVPIRAIGARAILDFPDQLDFSVCPVKYSSQKTLLVRNIGNREARYCISTESPFSVEPSIGTLGIGDAVQVTVEFHPLKTGDHSGSLVVRYDTGEDIHTGLYGVAENVNIGLARSSLTVEKTYLTLSNHRSMLIHNQSEIKVHFQWKAFSTQEEEDHLKLRLQRRREGKMDRCLRECKVDSALRECLPLLSCPFHNQQEKAQGDSMLFSDDVFTLEPLVVLFNKGAIDAVFNLVPPATALGSCFTFLPQEGIILPEGLQVIRISFSSTSLGEFTEEFRFSVTGSPEPVTLTIRGCVIGPTFHFNVPALHFGDVSFGFPHTLSCRLTNTSLVPLTFKLRVPGDGLGEPSVSSFAHMTDNSHLLKRKGAQRHLRPREFSIKPRRGTIRPLGFLDIQVTLCSNTLQRYELALVVDVCGVGRAVSALLLTARCMVPVLRVLNPVVMFGRCSLKYPYHQMLTLVNDSDLPGCYRVLPQICKEDASVWYSSPMPWGIVQPCSAVEVPLTLEAQVTGEQDTVARVAVFGSGGSPLKIHLASTGEGPVVCVHPHKINFGSIEVLQDASRTLHLSNQSVIPATIRAKMAGKCSHWRIEPSEGVIPPETEVSVAVLASLDDTQKFKDEVNLFIENSHTYVIPVRAVGTGTTIVTDKPFAPELNLGPHFRQATNWLPNGVGDVSVISVIVLCPPAHLALQTLELLPLLLAAEVPPENQ